MRRNLAVLFVGLLIVWTLSLQPARSDGRKPTGGPQPLKLKIGDTAPDFTLLAFDGHNLKKVSLQDYRGKKMVALAFYVFAFTDG
jgi:AhpC/TSA family